MILSDLPEIKHVLDIDQDDHSEDVKLAFLIEQVSEWFGEWLNRPNFSYQQRTEYYNGTGTTRLLLRSRPVDGSKPITVYVDSQGLFGEAPNSFQNAPGATALVYGSDYCLQIDQSDGITSRCGILIRVNDYWPKPQVRQVGLLTPFVAEDTGSIQVTYTAGWTYDTMPASLRLAANLAIARLRLILPIGSELGSESFQDISLGLVADAKDGIFNLVAPFLMQHKNWNW